MKTAVHITHETIKKAGGIGAVLSGLCSSPSYMEFFGRSVFYGPLFGESSGLFKQVGKDGEILYSSGDGHDAGGYSSRLMGVVEKYGVNIVYIRKEIAGDFNPGRRSTVDAVLVDIGRMREPEIDRFKYILWEKFRFRSELYENDFDFEQYLRIALPCLEIMEALFGRPGGYFFFAHEYMGVLSALSAVIAGKGDKTIFVAHEVSTARDVVEELGGHDISFYNLMRKSGGERSLEAVFGSREHNPRNEIIKLAVNFDRIFAVSDIVREEYEFLLPDVPADKIRVVYNGLSAPSGGRGAFEKSRELLSDYSESLLNYRPDVFLTHVTRLVDSKGIWRDITLLYLLDEIFFKSNIKAVYFLLSTAGGERPAEDVLRMEAEYGWPAVHRKGWPDLVGMEKDFYEQINLFNARAKVSRGVFLNQFGFSRDSCGKRVPPGLDFTGLRAGSDCELGFSVYEPFGIAQLETLPFGGAAALSSSCGSARMLEGLFRDARHKPFTIVDFIGRGGGMECSSLMELTPAERGEAEYAALFDTAGQIFEKMPLNGKKRREYIRHFLSFSGDMDWEGVTKKYFLPNLP